jgi:hypothetical protein
MMMFISNGGGSSDCTQIMCDDDPTFKPFIAALPPRISPNPQISPAHGPVAGSFQVLPPGDFDPVAGRFLPQKLRKYAK